MHASLSGASAGPDVVRATKATAVGSLRFVVALLALVGIAAFATGAPSRSNHTTGHRDHTTKLWRAESYSSNSSTSLFLNSSGEPGDSPIRVAIIMSGLVSRFTPSGTRNLVQSLVSAGHLVTGFQVLGNAKTIIILLFGSLFFDEALSRRTLCGQAVAVVGMALYSYSRVLSQGVAPPPADAPPTARISFAHACIFMAGVGTWLGACRLFVVIADL